MKKYKFRDNSAYRLKDAQKVGLYLEEKFKEGNITPQGLIYAARDKKSPLNEFFEWDDTKAAHAHRLGQARGLIGALYVEMDDGAQVRAYESVYVEEMDSRSYTDYKTIQDTPYLAEQVISTALRELNYWKLKYESYKKEFKPIFLAIEKITRSRESEEKARNRKDNTNTANRAKDSKNNSRRRNAASGL